MRLRPTKTLALIATSVLSVVLTGALIAILAISPAPSTAGPAPPPVPTGPVRHGDQELAYLLVKLELQTRAVIANHYTRRQSPIPAVDMLYKRWLTQNAILPAAVADDIFAEVVPRATAGRAWVKMVVDSPRNPNNQPDAVGQDLFVRIKAGSASAEFETPGAYYYAEPIRSAAWCLRCHGDPAGTPDPSFPQFKKDGWKAEQVVGAVVARVAAASRSPTPAE